MWSIDRFYASTLGALQWKCPANLVLVLLHALILRTQGIEAFQLLDHRPPFRGLIQTLSLRGVRRHVR